MAPPLSPSAPPPHHAHDVRIGDEVADGVRQRVAEVDAPVVDAERGAAQLRGEVVGQQRGGERRAAGLAEADAEPQQRQLPVLLGEAGQQHAAGPDQQAAGQQQLPAQVSGSAAGPDQQAAVEQAGQH